MKGLLIKDWKLLKNQRRFYGFVVIFALIMMIANENGYAYAGSYLTFLVALFALSTFSYDEQNDGMSYLLSLPVERKTYVKEKFLFGILLAAGSWFVSCLISVIFMTIRNPGESPLMLLGSMTGFLAGYLILLFATIPLQLKYGAEKGRLALVGAIGAVVLGFLAFSRIVTSPSVGMIGRFGAILEWVLTQHPGMFAAAAVLLYAAGITVSYRIAVRIMEKKEF